MSEEKGSSQHGNAQQKTGDGISLVRLGFPYYSFDYNPGRITLRLFLDQNTVT